MTSDLTTILSCAVIAGVFAWLLWEALRIKTEGLNAIENSLSATENPIDNLKGTRLESIANEYVKSTTHDIEGVQKSNIPASEYFSEFSVCKAFRINMKIIEAGAGTLVGLGLFGTFLGLTLGISGFDSSTSDNIQHSIQTLLNGMGTAFLTSLIGMLASLTYTHIEKKLRNDLVKAIDDLTMKLDDMYYIDDIDLSVYEQRKIAQESHEKLTNEFKSISSELFGKLQALLQYTNQNGEQVNISNAIREILTNNEEQTTALKSFSTDLALELNNGFDEALSRQMQQRLIPLMESVDATTRSVVEHIDQMALSVSNPATEMIERVIKDLKENLADVMKEFKQSISGNTTAELENLATTIGCATKAMGDIPQNMAAITETLQSTITKMRGSIAEMASSSTAANASAMRQMQEQIAFATSSISEAIAQVKDVMTNITLSSEQSSRDLIANMAKSSDETSQYMRSVMEQVVEAMRSSVGAMSTDLASQQTNLLALQQGATSEVKRVVSELSEAWKLSSEAIISQTESLLSRFDASIERMQAANSAVSGTMNLFQQTQASISGTTSHLQTISDDMKSATALFRQGQADYNRSLEKVQTETEAKLNDVMKLLETAGFTSGEYAAKFETIRAGLGQIFSQIQAGLNEYSRSVRSSIQRYLDTYTTSLTNTTDALSSTIQQQNDMVELLVDTVNNLKR